MKLSKIYPLLVSLALILGFSFVANKASAQHSVLVELVPVDQYGQELGRQYGHMVHLAYISGVAVLIYYPETIFTDGFDSPTFLSPELANLIPPYLRREQPPPQTN